MRQQELEKIVVEHKNKLVSLSQQSGISLPTSYFRTSFHMCWSCGHQILVFTWPGCREKERPREPRPSTIQYLYACTTGIRCWVNTCPYCHRIQGDHFLYKEPDDVFFGFDQVVDSALSYRVDMKALAIQSSQVFRIRDFHDYFISLVSDDKNPEKVVTE